MMILSDSDAPLMQSAPSEQGPNGGTPIKARGQEATSRDVLLWSACVAAALAMVTSPYRTRRELRRLQEVVRTRPNPNGILAG